MRWWPGPAAAVGAVSVRSTAAAFGGLRCALGAAMMANPSRLGRGDWDSVQLVQRRVR